MAVRFQDDVIKYDIGKENSFDSDFFRKSYNRSIMEKITLQSPKRELTQVNKLISSWRNQEISIVFGNLGRQPYLLDYYLDLCFSHEEKVGIKCQWKIPSNYQDEDHSDFLILIEPYFESGILKPESVKHLVVLTSHLSLNYSSDAELYYLHLSGNKHENLPDPTLEDCKSFKPPKFHAKLYQSLPNMVLLDVTAAKNAHQAYLKILTGKEIIRNRPFKIAIDNQTRLNILPHIEITKRRSKWSDPWIETFYWVI